MEYNYDAIYFPSQGGGGGGGGAPGAQGPKGDKGDKPNHEWVGTTLKIENPDGSWGDPVDLIGPAGAGSTILVSTTNSPTTNQIVDGIVYYPSGKSYVNTEVDGKKKLHLEVPSETTDISWSYLNVSDLPSTVGRAQGAVCYITSLDKYYYNAGREWKELQTGSGGGGGTGGGYFVGRFNSLDELKAAAPEPVSGKTYGYVFDKDARATYRYMFYTIFGHSTPDWHMLAMSDSSGFRLEPNPPIEFINYFKNLSEHEVKKERDDFMTVHPDIHNMYKRDSQLMVILEWPDTDPKMKVLVYQNWLNGEWVDTFGSHVVTTDISNYLIEDLKNGKAHVAAFNDLNAKAIFGVECVGDGVDLCDDLVENNKIRLSKIKTKKSDYLKLDKDETTKTIGFTINPTWRGVYDTKSIAESDIKREDRVHKETFFAVKEESGLYKGGLQFYVWDAISNSFTEMIPSGVVPAEVSGQTMLARLIKAGAGITLSGESNGNLTIGSNVEPIVFRDHTGRDKIIKKLFAGERVDMHYNDTDGSLTVAVKDLTAAINVQANGTVKPISTLKYETKFGQFSNADTTFEIPSMGIVGKKTESGTAPDKGEFIELQEGHGITMTKDSTIDGRFVISSDITQPDVYIGEAKSFQGYLKKIHVKNDLATCRDNELVIPALEYLAGNGTTVGQIAAFKAGSNVTFDYDADKDVVTVNSTGGGGSGSIKAKVADGDAYKDISMIDVFSKYNTIEGGKLVINPVKFKESTSVTKDLSSIYAGLNIDMIMTSTGDLSVSSFVDIAGRSGSTSQLKMNTIDLSNSKYTELKDNTVTLHGIHALSDATTPIDEVRNIVQGKGVKFVNGVDDKVGDITIDVVPMGIYTGSDNTRVRDVTGLKAGTNITLTPVTGSTNITTISANYRVKLDSKSATYTPFERLVITDGYSEVKSVDGKAALVLHQIDAIDKTGSDLGRVKNIRASDTVTFSRDSSGVVTIHATGGGGGGTTNIQAKVGEGSGGYANITKIWATNKFAEINGDELKLPVISAVGTSGDVISQIKNIKAGSNVTFENGSGSDDGVITINATGGGSGADIQAKVGSGTTYTSISKIWASNKYAKINGDELELPVISVVDSSGASVGEVKNFKAGSNITFTNGTGENEGVITVDVVGGSGGITGIKVSGKDKDNLDQTYEDVNDVKFDGNTVIRKEADGQVVITSIGKFGAVLAKTAADTEEPESWKQVDHIDVVGDKELMSIVDTDPSSSGSTSKTLTLNLRGITALGKTVEDLTAKYPVSPNGKRLGIVNDFSSGSKDFKIYYCDGSAWNEVSAKGGSGGESKKLKVFLSDEAADKKEVDAFNFGLSQNVKTSDFFQVKFRTHETDGEVFDLTIKDPIVNKVNAGSSMETDYPAASTPKGTIAYREKTDSSPLTCIQVNNGTNWGDIGYFGGAGSHQGFSGDHIKRLQQYFPDSVDANLHKYSASESIKHNGLFFIAKGDDLNPLPPSKKADCLVQIWSQRTQEHEGRRNAELIFDTDAGGLYYRYHGQSSTKSSSVEQIAGLSDKHFAIYTVENDFNVAKLRESGTSGYTAGKLPLCPVQDPNVNTLSSEVKPEEIQILRGGLYNLTLAFTLSGSNMLDRGYYYNITWSIKNALTGALLSAPAKYTIQSKQLPSSSYYYMESVLFNANSVSIPEGTTIRNEIAIEACDASGNPQTEASQPKTQINKSEIDPYKNYFVIEPASSLTKTGARTARTLRNTLGGVSYELGTEVRTKYGSGTSAGSIRVIGVPFDSRDLGIVHKDP